MARVAYAPTAFSLQPTGKNSRPVKDKSYLDFIRELPCIVTGKHGVQAAHISYAEPKYGKFGRGKSQKESDAWAIPLCPEEHDAQHRMSEREYWKSRGIDPCIVAMSIYVAYPSIDKALFVIRNIERSIPNGN